jgi:hypothetical protein
MNRKWKVGHVILWNVTENGRPAVKERYPNNFQTPPFYSNKQSKLNGVSQRLYTIHLLSCYIVKLEIQIIEKIYNDENSRYLHF